MSTVNDEAKGFNNISDIQTSETSGFSLKSARAKLRQIWKNKDEIEGILVIKELPLSVNFIRGVSYGEVPRKIKTQERPKPYDFEMDDDFLAAIEKVDAINRGKILYAIGKISRNPETLVGDTVKPLTGNLKGLWRYRIGDYRLVYRLDIQNRKVILKDFACRGSIYE